MYISWFKNMKKDVVFVRFYNFVYMLLDLISSKRLTMNKLVSKNLSTQLARQASSERSNLLLTLEIHLSYIVCK